MKNLAKNHEYNLFDFDYTIYNGNSAIDFYIACVRKRPILCFYSLVQIAHLVGYFIRLESKDEFKGNYFGFVKYISDQKDDFVNYFWQINRRKIKQWYLDRVDRSGDVVVSASPSYYLKPIVEYFGIGHLVATQINDQTGRMLGKNCYGEEKVMRIKELFSDKKFKGAYTDSMSDLPMLLLAERAYIVKGNDISEYIHKR